MPHRNLYAALIGINAYEKANSLNGCVRDVLNFDRILRNLCSQQQGELTYHPLYLLAPHPSDLELIEDHKKLEPAGLDIIDPTFSNISGRAFEHLQQAKGSDVCLLYYSGHGSFIEAHPVFWHTKPSHQQETLVCKDSRSTARDLLDVELAFLLHRLLDGKPDVHCLVIMDCCHSGDNTRAVNAEKVPPVYRQESPSNLKLQLEDYLGYKEGYFEVKGGDARYVIADYVHFAACRDHEKALDTGLGGLFSRRLAELLNAGGSNSSYRSLMQSLESTVSIENGLQNPVPFSLNDANLDKQFLGGKLLPYKPSYEVRYNAGEGVWQLQAGSLQGVVASTHDRKTLINIQPLGITAEVEEVEDFKATLAGDELKKLDPDSNAYTATITQLAIQRLVIGIAERLKALPSLVKQLADNHTTVGHIYIELDTGGQKKPDYMVDVFNRDNQYYYYLTQVQNDIPVFKSEQDPNSFLRNVDAVGKWVYVKKLVGKESIFEESDFIFTADIIEGASLTRKNISSLTGQVGPVKPGDQLDLSYKNDLPPLLRFSVEINPASPLSECYVQALYLDSLFGISTDFSEPGTNRLVKGGKLELKTQSKGKYYAIIKLRLDKEYASYNVNEILEQLKIVVSSRPNIQLGAYKQDPLELEYASRNVRTKAVEEELFDDSASQWAVFNFPVRIIGPQKDKQVTAGGLTEFSSFSLEAPAGFTAIATAVTNRDLEASTRQVATNTRMVADAAEAGRDRSTPTITSSSFSPPVWGETLTEAQSFGDAFAPLSGSSVIALELGGREGEPMPVLAEGQELILIPKADPVTTRSVEGYKATTIPYAYDEDTQLYFPIGYEDPSGKIHIQQLPKATAGSLVPGTITTRSVLGSIKLYFKKLLRLPTSTFALYYCEAGTWDSTTKMNEIRKRVTEIKPQQKLLLIVHGIFGDTKGMMEGLKEDAQFGEHFPLVLTYDYENLNTSIPETARVLKEYLKEAGVARGPVPKLTLVAHSMGGLVSRWLIEKEAGHELVDTLIMAGTPNGGSEWGKAAGFILDGAKFLLMHALNVTGPVKYAITGIGFLINHFYDPRANLKGMGIDGDLIKDLGKSRKPDSMKYYMIGSDTNLYRAYNGHDPFLVKVKNAFMGNLLFPGLNKALFHKQSNDMAVTLDSMKTIEGFEAVDDMTTLPGDHISYFSEAVTRKAILDLANK